MATSRTGTGKWKHIRAKAIRQAKADGLTNCPLCRQHLDWTRSQTPASPEVDHIVPHTLGGEDTIDNTRVICKRCNARLGELAKKQKRNEHRQQRRQQTFTGTLNTSQRW